MKDCIFCKIARHEIPKDFAYEDTEVMAFADINPIKEIHILIVPKKHIKDFIDIKDEGLMTKLKNVGQKLGLNLEEKFNAGPYHYGLIFIKM